LRSPLAVNNSPNNYKYNILGTSLASTSSVSACSIGNYPYTLNRYLLYNQCSWNGGNSYDFTFKGINETYANQEMKIYNQEYQFKGGNADSSKIAAWNKTYFYGENSFWNRAIGKAQTYPTLLQQNQSSNINNATRLVGNEPPYLLGLQRLDVDSFWDVTTYRPQLQTSYQSVGDIFGNNDTASLLLEGNAGAASRTRVRTKCYLMRTFVI
jgi:hypothetical protein